MRSFTGQGQWKIPTSEDLLKGGLGLFPRWSKATSELVFVSGNHILYAPYSVSGDEFQAREARLWAPTRYQLFGLRGAPYDLHPDGQRVAAVVGISDRSEAGTDHAVLVLHWLDELKRLVPVEKRSKP